MKKFSIAITTVFLVSVLFLTSFKKEENAKKETPMPKVNTLAVESVTYSGALLKAEVTDAGSDPIEAIGFVYWNADMFSEDLNRFFDTTSMFPSDILLGTVGGDVGLGTVGGDVGLGTVVGDVNLGTFGANIRIDTIDGEIFLGTIGGDIGSSKHNFLGTVGGGLNFPITGQSCLPEALKMFPHGGGVCLPEALKFINKQKQGTFSAKVNQMTPGTRYQVRAFAVKKSGIKYEPSVEMRTEKLFLEVKPGNGLKDWEGRSYSSVIINGTEWMAENLRTRRYNNGVEIPILRNKDWIRDTVGGFRYPNNTTNNDINYGLLYNGFATINPNQLCPVGWRLPTEEDFTDLIRLLDGPEEAGSKMKTRGIDWWKDKNEDATNESGFSARGAGGYTSGPIRFGNSTYFWTSTIYDTDANNIPIPRFYMLTKDNAEVKTNSGRTINARSGLSVRCIKN